MGGGRGEPFPPAFHQMGMCDVPLSAKTKATKRTREVVLLLSNNGKAAIATSTIRKGLKGRIQERAGDVCCFVAWGDVVAISSH